MRRALGVAALAFAAALTACGGGSGPGSIPPTPHPITSTAPAAHSISIVWRGAAHPSGAQYAQSSMRHVNDVAPPTPYPILVAPCDSSLSPSCVANDTQVVAEAIETGPSPLPSATPTWEVKAGPITIAPVVPDQSGYFPGAQVNVSAPSGIPTGVYQAVATFSDATSQTTNVNVYQRVTLHDNEGWSFTKSALADVAHADFYLLNGSINCPQGCRVVMNGDPKQYAEPSFVNLTATDFSAISPSLWANDFTTLKVSDYQTVLGTAILIVKDRDGSIAKFMPTAIGGMISGLGLSAAGGANFPY